MTVGNDMDRWTLNTGEPTRMGETYYHYDTANQLVREDSAWLGTTFIWTYDDAGNITSRTEYEHFENWGDEPPVPLATYTYTYGDSSWGDLLTAYNGIPRTYDQIGNLLTDGTWTYTWQNGRELASMTDGTTTWTYTYDANGMRTQRSNGTTAYNYVYNGSQLVQMTVGNDTLYFTYGVYGPATVTWNGEVYHYTVNGQGDVTAIFDSSGDCVVFYSWDNAWGYNPVPEGSLASTLGTLNPLRYRSYVYDTETGYYYLQSRYYDPEIGRFINADGYVSTGQGFIGHNMFAYCNNNPVNLLDPTGTVCCAIFGNNQLLHLNMQIYFSGIGGSSYASGGVPTRGHFITMKEYLDTSDPKVVFENLEKHGMAYYNGVPVLQMNFGDGGGLSLGIILLDDNYKYDKRGINALNHEYGHRLHMDDIGVVNYLVTTAIPSFLGATLKTLKVTDVHYYSLPWEYVADFYGGVNRPGYEAWANQAGARFLLYTLTVGSITDSITDMFTGGIR